MPNQSSTGATGQFEMAQCDVSLSYPTCKVEETLCKFGYTTSTWCPTCDKDSPRKRSKSETIDEPCRRRARDTRCSTKKYDWNDDQECENMEFEYVVKGTVPDAVRWDRVRSNLCELPTTYISNNHLKVSNQDYIDISTEKAFKSNDNLNYGNIMVERQDKYNNKLLPKIDESSRTINGIVSKSKQIDSKKLKPSISVEPHFPQPSCKSSSHNFHLDKSGNKEVDLNCCEVMNHSSIYYDTCSFFDTKIDISNLREQYCREVEVLKERLKYLKQNGHDKQRTYTSPIGNQHARANIEASDDFNNLQIKDAVKTFNKNNGAIPKDTIPINVDLPQKQKEALSSLSKVSLKTKSKLINLKFRKQKIKTTFTNPELSGSEYSDSDESCKDIQESESTDEISSESSGKGITVAATGSGDSLHWPLRPSLFPHIPPYLSFVSHDIPKPQKYPVGGRHLKWKLSTITPILIRKTLVNSGFRLVRKSNEWVGTWGKHMKSPMFQTLKDTQKLNHFPGTFQVGRKDRLWRNFQRLILRYGHKEFGFTPQTYVLPQDLKLLKQHWQNKDGCSEQKYIIKPPASARGTGIKVINRWCQLPKRISLVVQEYISNPFLINNSKFDLRLYVLVTSFNPLRIYLYPEGLARFASVPYSDDPKDLRDRFMHLTNYSINKLSNLYTANEDANSCKGHKWTLTKLWEYMAKRGINTKAIWKNLQVLVIKTMLSAESSINALCKGNIMSRYNCYELFGVDVLIDENLKCWLLEVNISPSLHSQSPLDEHVKGPLIKSLFNLAQFHLPAKLKKSGAVGIPPCYDSRIYTTTLTKKETNKHNYFCQTMSRNDYFEDILVDLTGDDVRFLTQAEDEFTVIGDFQRIFPTAQTYKYLEFMEVRYYNRLFDAWERKYEKYRESGIKILASLCEKKVHLKIAPPPVVNKSLPNSTPGVENQVLPTESLTQDMVSNPPIVPTVTEEEFNKSSSVLPIPNGLHVPSSSTSNILSSIGHVAV